MLYPFKFNPILKHKIWGGSQLANKIEELANADNIGESWEISDLEDDVSIVREGPLQDVPLTDLIEIYMGELVGDTNFNRFGLGFPLLVKFIDANDNLSFQVHPNDDYAQKQYNMCGKSEMWYVMHAEEGAGLYVGLKKGVTEEVLLDSIENQDVENVVNFYPVQKGDVFYIPAGTVHAIGKGVLLAEIQQPSDITFRLYDWNRLDEAGAPRDLHIEEALEAINFEEDIEYKIEYELKKNSTTTLLRAPVFNVNLLELDQAIEKNYREIDSFVIYICVEGEAHLFTEELHLVLNCGESILVPASIQELSLVPNPTAKVLEVYVS